MTYALFIYKVKVKEFPLPLGVLSTWLQPIIFLEQSVLGRHFVGSINSPTKIAILLVIYTVPGCSSVY